MGAGGERQATSNPTLLAELRLLRQRRDELEARMAALQDSRRELMVQLEGLMKLLKVGVSHLIVIAICKLSHTAVNYYSFACSTTDFEG